MGGEGNNRKACKNFKYGENGVFETNPSFFPVNLGLCIIKHLCPIKIVLSEQHFMAGGLNDQALKDPSAALSK